jgi:hypothetical protein
MRTVLARASRLNCPSLFRATQVEGEIPDALQSRFLPGTSVPQLCSALEKAALDPRIVGICFEVGDAADRGFSVRPWLVWGQGGTTGPATPQAALHLRRSGWLQLQQRRVTAAEWAYAGRHSCTSTRPQRRAN